MLGNHFTKAKIVDIQGSYCLVFTWRVAQKRRGKPTENTGNMTYHSVEIIQNHGETRAFRNASVPLFLR